MGRKIVVATCGLNQWALDFEGNYARIVESIKKAKMMGATYRSGPELEICGYGCGDHFYESDTYFHSWEVLGDILNLQHVLCKDILIDIGMPIRHKDVAYNCRVIILNRRIIMIRPKMILSNDGHYRESRWFTAWQRPRTTEDFYLPRHIKKFTRQMVVPFGDGIIQTLDTCIGYEMREELKHPNSPHVQMSLNGVELFVCSSGSYTEIRKFRESLKLIEAATAKCGGCYLFANQKGCDGERVYYPGNASIAVNGSIVGAAEVYTLSDVDVIGATIDLEVIRTFRAMTRSRALHAAKSTEYNRILVNFSLSDDNDVFCVPSPPLEIRGPMPEEEILYGPACWLWDYLRRAGCGGFLLPLSGGSDSAATAAIVCAMCTMIEDAITKGNKTVLDDLRTITGNPNYTPKSSRDICNQIIHTLYMSSENTSKKSKDRSKRIALQIGSYHLPMAIDTVVTAALNLFTLATGKEPKFSAKGGSEVENKALRSLQSRVRMICSYLVAQLLPWVRGKSGGGLLVLGSVNMDKCTRGYLTKYGSSSGDLNPIGGFSKNDLTMCLLLAKDRLNIPILGDIAESQQMPELEPIIAGHEMPSDLEEMNMTYDELATYGKLKKEDACGPYSMFCRLMNIWSKVLTPEEVGEKVKNFFRYYAMHRHKMTVITPGFLAESDSTDSLGHRPFLYNLMWTRQFLAIDKCITKSQTPRPVARRTDPDYDVQIHKTAFESAPPVHEDPLMLEDDADPEEEDLEIVKSPKKQKRGEKRPRLSENGPTITVGEDGTIKKSYRHKFQKRWLEVDEFKDWIRPSNTSVYAFFCNVCLRDGHGGLASVRKHAASTKHIQNQKKMDESKPSSYILSMPDVEPKAEPDFVHQVWI